MNKKRYKKATIHYEKGELAKALKECELGIAEDLKDSALLNLKGIILYQKGLLNEAIITWNINREYNDDSMAKSYIKDAKSDEEREKLYLKGEKLLKELKVDEALKLFAKCRESDFNGIKVNTAIGLCYFKKGMFDESRYYVLNALKIDKDYEGAKRILKELNEIGSDSKNFNKSGLVAICLILILCGGLFYMVKNLKVDASKSEALTVIEEKPVENEEVIEEKFDFSTLLEAVRTENVDKMYFLLKDVDKNKLNKKELSEIEELEDILKNKGVDYFYKNSQNYIKDGDYNKAREEIRKAYDYGKEHYLFQHIVYFRGQIAQKLNNSNDSIRYYEEYIKQFYKETYTEEVLYNLVILNKDKDRKKSKAYAEKLVKDYPKSMYNNNIVKGIINEE